MKTAFGPRFLRPLAFTLALSLSLSLGATAHAQLAPGAAASANEAPGAPLAAPQGMSATVDVQAGSAPSATPGEQRSMAFTAGGGQCRDTVPGGTLLALAYGAVIALLGVYTVLLAVKNVKLAGAVRDLEREVLKRAPAPAREGDEAP